MKPWWVWCDRNNPNSVRPTKAYYSKCMRLCRLLKHRWILFFFPSFHIQWMKTLKEKSTDLSPVLSEAWDSWSQMYFHVDAFALGLEKEGMMHWGVGLNLWVHRTDTNSELRLVVSVIAGSLSVSGWRGGMESAVESAREWKGVFSLNLLDAKQGCAVGMKSMSA